MIVVVGVSHRTAPLAVREALAFPRERMAEALRGCATEAGLEEAMILSTCNRVEIYGRAEADDAGGRGRWPRFLALPRPAAERARALTSTG